MIKFFRRIRQNLLVEGKTTKYFKYAIGEIILVVIGILIALQINTWNQERVLKNEEKIIVKNIHNEYLQNKKIIPIHIQEADFCEGALRHLMNLVGKDEEISSKTKCRQFTFFCL